MNPQITATNNDRRDQACSSRNGTSEFTQDRQETPGRLMARGFWGCAVVVRSSKSTGLYSRPCLTSARGVGDGGLRLWL